MKPHVMITGHDKASRFPIFFHREQAMKSFHVVRKSIFIHPVSFIKDIAYEKKIIKIYKTLNFELILTSQRSYPRKIQLPVEI